MNAPLLEAQGLLLRVGQRTLVREMSFQLNAGEVWCLLGPNGSGKSTFLHTAVGLREPQGGTLLLAGRALSDLAGGRAGAAARFSAAELFTTHSARVYWRA